jgi:GxxExxY protein
MNENEIGTQIVVAAMKIHQDIGPGLLESVYENILAVKLEKCGFAIGHQVPIPMEYEGIKFDEGFRADLVIDHKVIVEIKSVERLHNAHRKQMLTYLKLTGFKLGYLLNFGESMMKNGICRVINGKIY